MTIILSFSHTASLIFSHLSAVPVVGAVACLDAVQLRITAVVM
jgi:hypothetical protein